jgi:CheY-like chemotaxis protein
MKKRILIVEDDADIREVLRDLLKSEGYLVECAENGKEAIETLRAATALPQLILLDLMMPIMDGYAFRREQESDPRLILIPVILLTADRDIEAKREQLGARSFIRKPFDIDQAMATIARHCS